MSNTALPTGQQGLIALTDEQGESTLMPISEAMPAEAPPENAAPAAENTPALNAASPDAKFCPQCGAGVTVADVFCRSCGNRLQPA
jgi:membrane protease subunit (stomatin/prohibitin family)